MEENREFFKVNPVGKELHDEVVELINDAIYYVPKTNGLATTRTPFVINGLMPYSYGIYMSLLTGNILTCFMQLRLLIEYLALTILSDSLPGDNMLEKLSITREKYSRGRLSEMIENFDSESFRLWRSLSEWLHARSYSKKIEDIVISDGMKTWTIIQPAPYDKDDEKQLLELDNNIRIFRTILKAKLAPTQ